MKKIFSSIIQDLILIAGLILISYAVFRLHTEVGMIISGISLIIISYLMAKGSNNEKK